MNNCSKKFGSNGKFNVLSLRVSQLDTDTLTQLLTRTNNHHPLYCVTTCLFDHNMRPEIEQLVNESNRNIPNAINVFVSHVSLGNEYLADNVC